MSQAAAPKVRIPIWDRPTRLFHWSLVLLIGAAWWTARQELLDWHFRIGTLILFLLVFRLVWGLIGSSTARFSTFIRGPAAIRAYLRGKSPPLVGHNPLGALSVIALIGLLCVHVGLGLISTDSDGLNPAPLAHLVSYETSEAAQDLHEDSFDILLVLVGLHVAAVLYYTLIRRRNVIGPMVTGSGLADPGVEQMKGATVTRFLIASAVAFAAISLAWTL